MDAGNANFAMSDCWCQVDLLQYLRGYVMETVPPFPAPPGFVWVFCASFRHYRTGKQVFRKNGKCFAFLVRRK
ncbi:hypothetical protein XaplCFBP3123_18715 [Xanthomonas arboricola pv. populi]|nr:hypothetical protein XaplCFBP3123_18715 [Xanthomonas arboricola pv. populi]